MLTQKQVSTKIGGIKKSTNAIHNNVQAVLTSSAGHAIQHGDVTGFTRCYNVLGTGHQRFFLKAAAKIEAVRFDSKKGAFVLNRKFRNELIENGGNYEEYYKEVSSTLPNWWEKGDKGDNTTKVDIAKRIESLTTATGKDDVEVIIDQDKIEAAIKNLKARIEELTELAEAA